MAPPLAKLFYNLPEVSSDFITLLRDLHKSAPELDLMDQARAASQLTDTPMTKALERMVEYTNIPKTDYSLNRGIQPTTNILNYMSPTKTPQSTAAMQNRIEQRLGRGLSTEELQKLGYTDVFGASAEKNPLEIRALLQGAMRRRSDPATVRMLREEQQRRMALEYLLGMVD